MKILKAIAIAGVMYSCQSIFGMEEYNKPTQRVQYKPIMRQVSHYQKWIQPERDVITNEEFYNAVQESKQEGLTHPHTVEQARERAASIAQEEERLYVTPEMRRQREQQLREHYIQQREQSNMMSEQENW